MDDREDMVERLVGVLGIAGSRIYRMFEYSEVAEEVMLAHGFRPGRSHDGVLFLALSPSPFLNFEPALYRDHCIELCGRRKAGRDLVPGTRAEVMLHLMWASFDAPLRPAASALYQWIYRRACPELAKRAGLLEDPTPTYQGQIEQDLEEARRLIGRSRGKILS